MKKMNNRKGFTLAELLIVVAIIAVLVAIAIPVFTTQLEKAREATDMANIRNAYAAAISDYLAGNDSIDVKVIAQQKIAGWTSNNNHTLSTDIGSGSGAFAKSITVLPYETGKNFHVKVNAEGKVSIELGA